MVDRSDIDERIAKCNKILDENPSSQIFAALAEAHRKKGELDKAFRVCQNGLKIHPDYGSAHLVMAKINMDKGMYDWAEAEVSKAIELDGATRATELLLSEIYIYKGEFNKACRILEQLQQSDPGNEHITKLLDIARKIPLDHDHSGQMPINAPSVTGGDMTVAIPKVAKTVAAVAEADVPKAAPVPDMNYKQMLGAVAATPGIEGVLMINSDGLVIEALWNVSGDTALVGALAVEAARYTTVQMRESGFGNLQSMLMETDDSLYYMAGVRGKLLTVVCTEKVNLGSLKLKLTSLLPRLAG